MTQPESTLRYLNRAEVEAAGVSMREVIDAVDAAFRAKGAGDVELPAKTAVHPGSADSFIHAMPAAIAPMGAVGMKWIAGYPENQSRDLLYINGLLIMNDPTTGIPVGVMDATWITAVRTAAASAVSARHLARPESRSLAILGCGVQGLAHLEALPLVLPSLADVRAFDPDPGRAQALAAAAERAGLRATVAADAEDAVRGADAVVTAGPILHEPHATIRAGWMAQGAFASAVDFDSYWHADALAELDLFTTDDVPQLEQFRESGFFRSIPPIDADLGELATGRHPGRTDDRQRAMACNLGVAIDDVAVGLLVLRAAERRGLGSTLSL